MIQEIIVFALFGFIIAYFVYRFFFKKSTHTGGCDKCASSGSRGTNKTERIGKES